MNNNQIEWKNITVENYEEYLVSNTGQVMSPNYARSGLSGVMKGKTHRGYTAINFKKVGCKQRTIMVHRLVAEAFIGPCPEGCEVDHINRNRSDNRVENLRYISHKENCNNRNPIK